MQVSESNIAEIEPPYMAAKYKDASILIPVAGASGKVTGSKRAIAMVAESPGIAPTNRPIHVPTKDGENVGQCQNIMQA